MHFSNGLLFVITAYGDFSGILPHQTETMEGPPMSLSIAHSLNASRLTLRNSQ